MRGLILAALLLVPGLSAAQEKGTELGLGITALGVDITGGETVFQFLASQRYVSVGLYVSPTIAIEPAASLNVTSGGGATIAVLAFGVGVPVHTTPNWGRQGLFFAPAAAVTIVSADALGSSASATQVSVGLDVGTKVSIVDAVSLRVAGGFAYGLANDTFDDVISLTAQLGVSVFFN
jgi:hypothetical protein